MFDGKQLRALGFGAIGFGEKYSWSLKYVDLTMISINKCTEAYKDDLLITNNDMCHSTSSKADACQVSKFKFYNVT